MKFYQFFHPLDYFKNFTFNIIEKYKIIYIIFLTIFLLKHHCTGQLICKLGNLIVIYTLALKLKC